MAVIRVIYRWHVDADRHVDFARWWHEGTLRIRAAQPGSLGSTLCCSDADPDVYIGIARWRSRQDVEAFWTVSGSVSFDGAELESVELLDELDNLSVEDA